MFPVDKCDLPDDALLATYRDQGAYTDCYTTHVDEVITQEIFVVAFYSTSLFRVERVLLRWLASKPSTDADLLRLADGSADAFAAWNVEARQPNQLLLSDFRGRTRSWLMAEPIPESGGTGTRLYFGSAVLPSVGSEMSFAFKALIGFHKIYSEALLYSAKRACRRLSAH